MRRVLTPTPTYECSSQRIALGLALEEQENDIVLQVWTRLLPSGVHLSAEDERHVKRVTALAVRRIARWLQDESVASAVDREQVAIVGEAIVRSNERYLMNRIARAEDRRHELVSGEEARLSVSLVLKMNLLWRSITISVLGNEVRRLGCSGSVLESASTMVIESSDFSLLRMAQRYDVMIDKLTVRLAEMGLRDELTRLLQRSAVRDRLEELLRRPKDAWRGIAVLFIDLDNFKEVNDQCGHEVGDNLLAAVARRVTGEVRSSDVAGRVGGDEFLVVCDGLASPREEGEMFAKRILGAIASPIRVGSELITIQASIGVAIVAQAGNVRSEEVIAEADRAMYHAKRALGKRGPVVVEIVSEPSTTYEEDAITEHQKVSAC